MVIRRNVPCGNTKLRSRYYPRRCSLYRIGFRVHGYFLDVDAAGGERSPAAGGRSPPARARLGALGARAGGFRPAAVVDYGRRSSRERNPRLAMDTALMVLTHGARISVKLCRQARWLRFDGTVRLDWRCRYGCHDHCGSGCPLHRRYRRRRGALCTLHLY